MTLRLIDGFDHLTSPAGKWTTAMDATNVAGAARTGTRGCRVTQWNLQGPRFTYGNQQTVVIGFAFRFAAGPGASRDIVTTRDNGADQGHLKLNAARVLELYRGAVLVATGTTVLAVNTWYYIEFKHLVDAAAGLLEARINEVQEVTFSGNTQATANATSSEVCLRGTDSIVVVTNIDFDDVYIVDGSGVSNNDYLGMATVETLVPTGAGTYTQLATLVGAPTHWEAVDDATPDDDATYVADSTVGNQDSFAFGNLSVISALIPGIQVNVRGREESAFGGALARVLRSGGADNIGADNTLQPVYQQAIQELMPLNPLTGANFTVDEINAAEFGFRVR